MKQYFFIAGLLSCIVSCSDSGTKNGSTSDTSAPVNATAPTPTNPGGLAPNNGTTTPGNSTDSSTNMNDLNRPKKNSNDSAH